MLEKMVEQEKRVASDDKKAQNDTIGTFFFPYVFTYLLVSQISILFRSSAVDSHLPFSSFNVKLLEILQLLKS